MNIKEMRKAVEILGKEWNLGKKESGAEGNICAWIYLMEILEESEKIITYKENGELVGFCGYAKWNSKKHLLRKKLAKIILVIIILITIAISGYFVYNKYFKDEKQVSEVSKLMNEHNIPEDEYSKVLEFVLLLISTRN